VRGPDRLGLVALALAAIAWVLDASAVIAWPAHAGRTLVGLFALVGLSRLAQQVGGRPHASARSVIVGIAGTGAVWFVVAASYIGEPALWALAAGHAVVVAVALPRAPGDPSARRLLSLAAIGGLVLSALALASLPDEQRPASIWVPSLLAAAAIVGAYLLARGKESARLALGPVGVISMIYAARALAVWHRGDAAPSPILRTAAITLAIAASPLVADAARRWPAALARAWPDLAPAWQRTLATLTWPAIGALAAVLLASR
jgi:hypothetical protein